MIICPYQTTWNDKDGQYVLANSILRESIMILRLAIEFAINDDVCNVLKSRHKTKIVMTCR